MSLQKNLPFCIMKHTKGSVIKSNVNTIWAKFTLFDIFTVADIFNQFLMFLPKDEPLMNTSHSEWVSLVSAIM